MKSTVRDVMTTRVIWVRKAASFREMAAAFREYRISAFPVKRLPVVDAGGHLAGVIGRGDVLSVFDRTDTQIRNEIMADVLHAEFLIDPKEFKVRVKDGVVTLEGRAGTAVLGQEIARRVRHVQGVVAVRDRLSYPPAD